MVVSNTLMMLYTQAERERISQVQVKLIKADEVERGGE
jgi:hypothetical protein